MTDFFETQAFTDAMRNRNQNIEYRKEYVIILDPGYPAREQTVPLISSGTRKKSASQAPSVKEG